MKRIGWVDLHHHSEFSLLDGYGSVADHVARAKELGHPAVAFTEHGTARGYVQLHRAAKEAGIRPIYGLEFYVTRDHSIRGLSDEQKESVGGGLKANEAKAAYRKLEDALGISERRHLVVIAEDEAGFHNILKLNNIANERGFYYRPRIDLDLLEQYAEGLWVSSACLGGVLAQSWLQGDYDRLVEDAERLRDMMGGRFSLEIQPHNIDEQYEWNLIAVKLSKALGIPLIATNDSHYVVKDDYLVHDSLLAIGRQEVLSDPSRHTYKPKSFALKSEEELLDAFDRYHPDIPRAVVVEAMERAAMIAERCVADFPAEKRVLLPNLAPPGRSAVDILRDLAVDGWHELRDIDSRVLKTGVPIGEYVRRLKHELKVIGDLDFANYFLVLHDMLSWARKQGIMIGPGRGSSAGSLVCYLLGITAIDPLEHGLLFERFLTPGRTDYPDIDVDIERERRHEVYEYLQRTYGPERVGQIGTISRMRGRSALRDVARVHEVPIYEVEAVVSAIVGSTLRDKDDTTIREALETTPAMREFAKKYPDVIEDVLALEGHVRHVGIHAAGVVVTPEPLSDIMPLELRKAKDSKDAKLVIGYDMVDVEQIGGVKIDLLGLKTLSVLADAVRLVGPLEEWNGDYIDLEQLDFDDPKVLDAFTEHDFAGVFQFDSPSARSMAEGVRFRTFSDVVALNAINRPGPAESGLADDWKRHNRARTFKHTHPVVDEICSDSLGVVIYQEHIIRILQELVRFSPERAGKLRRAIAKSKGAKELEPHRDDFVDGAVAGGMSRADADSLWDQFCKFGRYGFNKSHATAYSAIGYWCMWMKLYHPVEFFTAMLRYESDQGKVGLLIREAVRRGITIDPPEINASDRSWSIADGNLLAGIGGIKGIGDKACDEIVRHKPYTSIPDLLIKVNRRVVNKGVLVALAKAGALRAFVPNVKWFLENIEDLLKSVGKSKSWMTKFDEKLAASVSEADYTHEDLWALQISVGSHGDGTHPMGILESMDNRVLRSDWGRLDKPKNGDLVRGVVVACKIGTARGERWASLEIEDEQGAKLRLRFGDTEYRDFRHVIDEKTGTLVAARIEVDRDGRVRCRGLWDLLALRADYYAGGKARPDAWEVVKDLHPLKACALKPRWADRPGKHKAVVVWAKEVRTTKTRRKMGFVMLDGGPGSGPAVMVTVFPDDWDACGGLQYGDVVSVSLTYEPERGTWIARHIGILAA